MLSVFLAHAPADAPVAHELRTFLEIGCDEISFAPDAVVEAAHDLISAAEWGHSADVVILLLSPASNPPRWPRDRWEPVLLASGTDTRIAIFLLEECAFPPLLRRGLKFFDGTGSGDRLQAMRHLKRWIWGIQAGAHPAMVFSSDLKFLYYALADKPGIVSASGSIAERFSRQAVQDFEAVFWIAAHGRNLIQIAGELGARLPIALDGPPEDNYRRIHEAISRKRYLLVLDAPQVALDPLLPPGRTSILITTEPVRREEDERSLRAARALVSARRFAEAYEILYQLLHSGIEPESCARELVWICEHWDRHDEANALRFHFGPSPSEQLRLF